MTRIKRRRQYGQCLWRSLRIWQFGYLRRRKQVWKSMVMFPRNKIRMWHAQNHIILYIQTQISRIVTQNDLN